ncbi:hypothetical protein LCGC14_1510720 [marine sediment metagenome]|uniref:Calcineurin-like phosphoesterase domain-containing protein n=1 Tax=marine sediment metagenome TaxID=412755 RepID=A0A0F9LGV6_9ZZZZ
MNSSNSEKVTCLAVGDPHFQVNNVTDAEELIKKVNKLVKQLHPTFVVILGDLLHTHEKVHTTPFNIATRLIITLARKVQVFLIIGNHDYVNNQQYLTNKHPFNSFKKIENVTVCDHVVLRTINGMKFIFCPFLVLIFNSFKTSNILFCCSELTPYMVSSVTSLSLFI